MTKMTKKFDHALVSGPMSIWTTQTGGGWVEGTTLYEIP